MKFEDAAIELEPRSVGSCADLALVFLGRHRTACLALLAVFAVPAGAATYWLAARTDYGLLWAVLILALATVPLGVCLVTGAAMLAFGEPWRLSAVLRRGLGRQWQTVLTLSLLRPVLLALYTLAFFPGVWLAVQMGFMAESRVFAAWRKRRHEHQTADLLRLEFSDLTVRAVALWLFGAVLWGVAVVTIDFAATVLFGTPLIVTRLMEQLRDPWGYAEFDQVAERFFRFIFCDPPALTVAVVAALPVYVLCRLAWFFSYVDVRIRRDCWDLEVALAEESHQWDAAS